MEKALREKLFRYVSGFLVLMVVTISVLTLVGWGFDIAAIKHPVSEAPAVNPLTAVNLILLSIAFFIDGFYATKKSVRGHTICITLVFFTCLYKLADSYFGFGIHVDDIFFGKEIDADSLNHIRSQMAVTTALNLVLLSVSLFLMNKDTTRNLRYQLPIVIVIVNCVFVIFGYLYQVPEFFGLLAVVPMSPASAIGTLLLSLALILVKPGEGLASELTSPYSGALVARYVLPLLFVFILLVGYFKMWNSWQAIFSTENGATVALLVFAIIITAIGWAALVGLNRRDAQRQTYEESLRRKNEQLTASLADMAALNEEYATTNEELNSSNEELAATINKLENATQIIARQKDEQLNRVLDSSNDAIWSFDLTENDDNYLSRSAERIYGEPIEELIKRPRFWIDRLHPDDKPLYEQNLKKLESVGYIECTYRIHTNHGIRWMNDRLRLITDKQGKALRLEGIASDITTLKEAQRRSEDVLQKSEERMKAFVENSVDITSVIDFDGHLLYTSPNVQRILEYETMPSTYKDLVHPDDLDQFTNGVAGLSGNPGTSFESVMRVKNKTGEWRWFEGVTINLYHVESVKGILSNHRDITERKRMYDELKKSQYFLEKATEAGSIGYWTSEPDPENGKLTWSKGVFNIFQIDEGDFNQKNSTLIQIVHPDDRKRVLDMARIAIEGIGAYNIDHRIVLKDGRVKWVNQRAQILRNEKNEAQLLVGVVQDINDRKIIEEVLREYNDRYEILSKATNDVIWDWDIEQDKVVYNDSMRTVLGYDDTSRKSTSAWWAERIHPQDHDRIMAELNEVFAAHLPKWDFKYRYISGAGDYRHIQDRAYVVYDATGKPKRMIGSMQDVTELTEYRLSLEKKVRERTEELNKALEKERDLVEMKSNFVSIASHEFRTPLATISLATGYVKRYKARLAPEEIDKKLEAIETQVKHMSTLLNDVLTIGKSESGKLEVVRSEFNVKSLMESLVLEVVNSTQRTHQVKLLMNCQAETFLTDEGLMRNIIINLLTNAIKFSPNSNLIELKVSCEEYALIFSVRDYGLGIPAEDLPKLFEPFVRAKNVGNIRGTGLGLSIVRKAVDLLGGDISISSEVGKGTEFTVILPPIAPH